MSPDEILTQRLNDMANRNARVAAASQTKQTQLSTESARKQLEAQRAAYELTTAMRTADAIRNSGQLVDDAILGATSMVDSVVSGAASGLIALQAAPNDLLESTFGPDSISPYAHAISDGQNQVAADILADSYVRGRKRSAEKSDISQVNNAIVDAQNAQASLENRATYDERVANGVPSAIAGVARVGSDIIDSAGNSLGNPTVLFDDVTASAPTLLLGPLGRLAATEAQIVSRAATLTARAAAIEGGEVAAANVFRQRALEEIVKRNTIAGTAATEGLSSFAEVGGGIANTSIEELAQRFPEVNQKLAAGISEDEIRNDLALRVGGTAGTLTGLTAGTIAAVVPNINVDPLGTANPGRSIASNVRSNLVDVVGEGLEETAQSGLGELSANVARAAAGEDVDLLEGVGIAAGRGGVAGITTAGVVRSPALALTTSIDVARYGGEAVRNFVRGRINEAEAAGQAELNTAREEKLKAQSDATADLMQTDTSSLAPEVAQAVDTTINQRDSFVPADLGNQKTETGEKIAPRNRLEAHTAAVYELFQPATAEKLTDERRFELQAFVAKNARELEEQIQTVLIPALDRAQTPEEQERIQGVINHLSVFSGSPEVQQIRDGFAQFSEEDTKRLFDSLPDSVIPENTPIPPQTAAALAMLNELAIYAPDKVTPEMAERGLGARSNMSPVQRARLELVRELAKNSVAYEVDINQVFDKTGFKSVSDVRNNVVDTGFKSQGPKLLSIPEHFKEIAGALAEGRVPDAKAGLVRLGRWAKYARDRAAGAQNIALSKLELDDDSAADVTLRTVNQEGKLINSPFKLLPKNKKSLGVVQVMTVEANMITESYNSLAQAYPELGGEIIPTVPKIDLLDLQGSPEKVRRNISTRALVDAEDRRVNLEAFIGDDGRVQLRDAEPMSTQQKAPAVFLPNGKTMTEAQLEMLLTGQNVRGLLEGKTTREVKKANEQASQNRTEAPTKPENQETEAKVAPVEEEAPAPAEQVLTPEDVIDPNQVDFNDPTQADQAEIDRALAMSPDEYFAAVGGNKITEEQSAAYLVEELDDIEVSSRAEEINSLVLPNGEKINLMADGNFLYAVVDGTDLIVGRLAASTTGVELSVRPDAQYKGKGIGKMMMRELLTRQPLAPAGSMTAGAQALRLSVLNEMRAKKPATLAERFVGLTEVSAPILDTDTKAQKGEKQNRILASYEPVANDRGFFSRVKNSLLNAVAAIEEGNFSSLLPKHMQNMSFDQSVIDQISNTLAIDTAAVIEEMNKQLNAVLDKPYGSSKQPLRQLLISGKAPNQWNYEKFKSLHGVVFNEDGTANYQQEIAEAIALAAIRWSIDSHDRPVGFNQDKLEKVLRNWGKNGISEAMRKGYETGFSLDDVPRQIVRDAENMLGIRAKQDVPKNFSQEVMGALALQAISSMAELKYLTVNRVDVPGKYTPSGNASSLSFVQFPKESNWKGRFTPPPKQILGLVLDHFAVDLPSIEKIPRSVNTKIKGNSQRLSDEQRQVEEAHNKLAFTLNTELSDFIEKLGLSAFRRIRGYDEQDLTKLNENHATAIRGLNQSIEYEDNAITDLVRNVNAYADGANKAPGEVKVYWNHRTAKNARVMAQGVAPQNHKTMRELFTLGSMAITKGDVAAENRMLAAVAQSLGLAKLEHTPDVAIAADKVREVLALPQMSAVLDAMLDPQPNFENLLADLTGSTKVVVDSTKAIHALLTLARYRAAEAGTQFEYGLTVEIDGVNNGPHNAHIQFLTNYVSERDLEQMEQGGVFVGQGEVTLSSKNNTLGDRYRDTSAGTLANYTAMVKSIPTNAVESLRVLDGVQRAMTMVKFADVNEQGDVTGFSRSFGKSVLVPVGYMSGQLSVSRKIASAMKDELYARVSAVLTAAPEVKEQAERDLVDLIEALNQVMSHRLDKNDLTKQGRSDRQQIYIQADERALRKFTLTDAQIELLTENINASIGKAAYNAAVTNMGASRESLEAVVEATKLLSSIAQIQFNKMYKQKVAELIESGQINSKDGLSEAQEREILKSLQSILPVVALEQTTDDDADEGISVATRGAGTTLEFVSNRSKAGFDKVRTQDLSGDLRSDVKRGDISEPGVAMAPMMVIGSGDASMVHKLFMLGERMIRHLQIWDGLDVHPELMEQLGVQANQAAFETWNNTMLYNVRDMLMREDSAAVETLTEKDGEELVKLFELKPKPVLDEKGKKVRMMTSLELVADFRQQLITMITNKAVMRDATWTALKELGVSTDQMAGANKAFYAPGTSEALTRKQVVDYVKRRTNEILSTRVEEDTDRLDGSNQLNAELPRGKDVAEYGLDQVLGMLEKKGVLKGKINSFVLNIIKSALPKNLRLVMGKPDEVSKIFAERHPNLDGLDQMSGYYMGGSTPTIYLRNFSPVTLTHELVHAATATLIETYYNGGKLTGVQKAAVAQLEKLGREFLNIEPDGSDFENGAFRHVQSLMRDFLEQGRMPEFVAEFLAYTLTDRRIHKNLMKRTLSEKLQSLKKWAVDSIRRLLGLPKNEPMDTWLTEILGQTMNLVRDFDPSSVNASEIGLGHVASVDSDPRLARLNTQLGQIFSRIESNDRLEAQMLHIDSQRIMFDFLNAGFDLSFEQKQVFEKIQAVFASGLQLDTEVFRAMQRVYDSVMPQLSYKDFMDSPDSSSTSEVEIGMNRYKALNNVSEDKFKRSNHLANFVALAMVDDKFREKLSSISPPKLTPKSSGSTIDDVLRKGMTNAINTAGSLYTLKSVKNLNQQAVLDTLMNRMIEISNKQAQREKALKEISLLEKAETRVVDVMKGTAEKFSAKAQKLTNSKNVWAQRTGSMLGILSASLSEDRAAAWKEAQISNFNEFDGSKTFRELVQEIVGTSESAYPIALLLNQSKQHVSTLRQRLREETPRQVKEWFSKTLTKETWQEMTALVGYTDFSFIWNSMEQSKLLSGLIDDAVLKELIAETEAQLDSSDRALYIESADDLAHWMVNKSNKSKRLLYRNAGTMAKLPGLSNVSDATAAKFEPILDQLVSLKAMQKLSSVQRGKLHKLLTTEADGMNKVLNTLGRLTSIERSKGNTLNQWKGYVPVSEDPRKQVRLATAEQGKELVRTGWRRVASYSGDSNDLVTGLAYYESSVGSEITYSQGALQLVVETAGGSLAGTGQSLSKFTGLVIQGNQVNRITQAKVRGLTSTAKNNLIPIFGTDVNGNTVITGYERTLDDARVKQVTRGDEDLAVGLGMWMGRQAEETTAAMFNQKIGDALKDMWTIDQQEGRDEEYIVLNKSEDPIDKGTWEAIPDHTKSMLLDKFDGKVMVRRDARNNAFGYRNASVRDVFTGYSGLNPDAKKVIREVALTLMGKNAFAWLAQAEDLLIGAVSTAKDVIVVRSGVVALGNLISNQFQLLAMGVPLTELPKQFKIAKEIETYLRNVHRIARITAELRAETDPVKLGKLEREAKMLDDNNKRMSIADLIAAGELPTIAEGLSEADEYTLVGDAAAWLQKKTENLPKGLTDAGRYALMTRDTALYLGLNRIIQFGDLMAKQMMYEQLQREGQTKQAALREVQDTFVNYNILPGRTRSALENMGGLWFWNYKLRIQRIFFRTVRKHPLRALIHMGGADLAGANSLFSTLPINTDLTYTMGPGQLARAHELHLWAQMTR